jgi:hypothetical protein
VSRFVTSLIAALAVAAALTISVVSAGSACAQPAPTPDPPAAEPAPSEPPLFAPPAAPNAAPNAAPTAVAAAPMATDDDVGDQAISAQLGLATGGRVTPGGLRIEGHYLYQLSERDFFDGAAAFTFGSGRAACFRNRQDAVICNHGLADGSGVELAARIRRIFEPRGAFTPFAQLGIGVGVARFSDDDVTGLTIPLHGGGGVRASVTRFMAVVAEADLALGFGAFGNRLGYEPQAGFTVTAGVEFRLR